MNETPYLYRINPNTWGEEWYVLAYSKEQALECLKKHLKEKSADEKDGGYYEDLYKEWKDATVDHLVEGYTIDEHRALEIIESEVA